MFTGFDIVKYHFQIEKEFQLPFNEQIGLRKRRLLELKNSLLLNKYYKNYCNTETWEELPIIDKRDILENKEQILYNPNNLKLNEILTSGSSGVKGVTYLSNKELMINRSIQILWWQWAGYRIGQNVIQLGVGTKRSLIKKLKDYFLNVTYLPVLGLNEEDIQSVLSNLDVNNKYFIGGYASSLFLFAKIAKESKKNMNVLGAISWGDKLFDTYRNEIFDAWGIRIFNTYGSSEGFNIAAECAHGRMHIMTNHVYVEVVDENSNLVEDGDMGYVVVTRLDSSIFPFVRYKLGDLIRKGNGSKSCLCGRNTDYIEEIIGRETDIIKYQGGLITVQTAVYLLKQIKGLDSWQIVYKDFQFIKILIKLYDSEARELEILQKIKDDFMTYTHGSVEIRTQFVDEIKNYASGKPKLFVRLE